MSEIASTKTVEQIRTEIKNLEGLLATMSGGGLCTWDGRNGIIADTPDGPGFELHVDWAINENSYVLWYRDIETPRANLLNLARENGCAPSANGLSVDLTSPGCHTSRAWIQSVNTEHST